MSERQRGGCEKCRTPKFPDGRPFCGACRPDAYRREVERLKSEIRLTGSMTWTDEITSKPTSIRVPVPRNPRAFTGPPTEVPA